MISIRQLKNEFTRFLFNQNYTNPMNQALIEEVKRQKTMWSICAATDCADNLQHKQKPVLCIVCIQWFHESCQDFKPKENSREYSYYTVCFQKGKKYGIKKFQTKLSVFIKFAQFKWNITSSNSR